MTTPSPSTDTPFTDAELVAQTLAGSREAFAEIVSRYQTLICSLTYSTTGSFAQSEDLAQETFLTAWQRLSELREPGSLRSWLCGIARNLNRRALRDQSREPSFAAEPLEAAHHSPATEAPPPQQAISREEEAILWRAIERIPELYREPLVLSYRQHQEIEQIAAALEISPETARQRLSRGRKLLQDEVSAFVEGALRRSAPDAGFCGAVMLALPAQAGMATAVVGGTKASTLAAWISWSVAGLFASLLGSLGLVRLAATERVRRFTVRMLAGMWLDCVALWIALAMTYWLRGHRTWSDSTFALAQLVIYFVWAAVMAALVVVAFRRFVEFHREITPPDAPRRAVRPSRSAAAVAALMVAGSLAWLVQLTWAARDFAALAFTVTTAALLIGWIYFSPSMLQRGNRDAAAFAWVPAATVTASILALLNTRLDLWIAALRGTSVSEAQRFLPMSIVHGASAVFLAWVAFLVFFTRATGPRPA